MILIVGGTGKLGSHLTHRLLENGARVRVMTREPSRAHSLSNAGAEIVKGDLLDEVSVKHAMNRVRTVISSAHSILGSGKNRSAAVDGIGQRTLIAASEAAGVEHFLFVSASGASSANPIDFGRTKAEIEQVLAASTLHHTIVRPTAFMEVHTYELIGKQVVNGKPVVIFGKGENPRSYVAEQDVAALIVRVLDDKALQAQIIEMGGPENLSTMQVIAVYEKIAGRQARVVHLPLAIPRLMSPVVRTLHDGIGRVLESIVYVETTTQTFDANPFLARFPVPLTRLEDWAREHVARQSLVIPQTRSGRAT
ncbi:MAG: SDR family oxidoreductase [Gemmatimonadaceae bacterium]